MNKINRIHKDNMMQRTKCNFLVHKHIWLAFLFLLLVHFIFARGRNIPIILHDELGYLSNAATFSGYDWSSTAANTPYYGVGYSLLLVPFFILFKSPSAIYRAALILNALLASGAVFIVYSLNEQWIPDASKTTKTLIAVCVSLYPSGVIYAKVAMAESMLIFLFWISIWLISRLEKKNNGMFALFGVVTGCTYMVHYRMLAVVIASLVTMVLLLGLRRIRKPAMAYYLAGLISMFLAESILHRYIIEHLHNGNAALTNTLVGSSSKVGALLRMDQAIEFITTLMGQSYYLMSVSYLLVLTGFFSSLFLIFKMLTNREDDMEEGVYSYNFYPAVFFMLASFAFMMGISVVMLHSGIASRLDFILYGRYNEAVVVGLLYMGLIAPVLFVEYPGRFRNILLLSVATYAAVSLYAILFIQELMDPTVITAPINILGLTPFLNGDTVINFLVTSAVVIAISVLCMVLQRYRLKIGLIYYCAIFLFIIYFNMNYYIQPITDRTGALTEISEKLEAVTTNRDVNVYYYLAQDNLDNWLVGEYYQNALPEVELQVIDHLEAENGSDYHGYIIGVTEDDVISQWPEAELIFANDAGVVWVNLEHETTAD